MKFGIADVPEYVKEMLVEFSDIMVDDFPNEFPLKWDISHHIEFIPREIFPNKEAYRLTPEENEEIRR